MPHIFLLKSLTIDRGGGGQRAHLLLQRSKFNSRSSLQFLLVNKNKDALVVKLLSIILKKYF